MQTSQTRLQQLFDLWIQRESTLHEEEELMEMLAQFSEEEQWTPFLQAAWEKSTTSREFSEIQQRGLINKILLVNQASGISGYRAHRVHFLRTAWFRYAAAIILVFGMGAYYYYISRQKAPEKVAVKPIPPSNNIVPGGDKAILTLADGSTIVLDNAANGELARQNGSQVIKKSDGRLEYQLQGVAPHDNAVISYNTMRTPKGGQYQLGLPDGTKVWLNAASSITYPTAFIGEERQVSVTGEVYFEVVKNAKMPFKVRVNDNPEIEVLGTHFNVNAYADEATINTTLLEGKVKVGKGRYATFLAPGQQAQLDDRGKISVSSDINIQEVIAWKNGFFQFNRAGIKSVMRQVSRWYDVDINYEGEVPERVFGGKLSRQTNLPQLLKVLEESNVHFRIEGKKIIVLP